MLSLWPQSPPTPITAHQRTHSRGVDDGPLLSLSAWYATKIPEIIRAAPNLPASLYGVVTSILNIVNPYPPLPNELIHHIFTFAATSDLEICRQLCMVSSWTRMLVLPHLMPTVVIRKHQHWLLEPTSNFLLNDQWISPTLFTKHLWINRHRKGDAADMDFRTVFSRCPNVTSLSVPARDLPQIFQQNASEMLPHTTSLIVQGHEKLFEHRLSFFAQITDLRFDILPDQLQERLDLSAFPAVSHLTIDIPSLSESGPFISLLSDLGQWQQSCQIVLRLPFNINWKISSGDRMTMGDIVKHAASLDHRLVVSEEDYGLDWISWQAELEGRPIFMNGEQIS